MPKRRSELQPTAGITRLGRQNGVTILGMGRALPANRYDNAAVLARAVAYDGNPLPPPEGLTQLMGVTQRYWAHEVGRPADHAETTSQDLAIAAARAALADANLEPGDVDALLIATTTAPRPSVNTGNHVAAALGLGGYCLEIKAGCAGSLYGLATATGLVAMGAKRVLLVATEAWSKLMPAAFPGPMAIAGDGAAAVVLGPGTGAFLGGAMGTWPQYASAMMPPGLYPPTAEAIAADQYTIRLSADVAALVRDLYPLIYDAALGAAGLARSDIDRVIPHQASLPIIRRALRDCGVTEKKAFHTLSRYGNASSASVLLSLHDARAERVVVPGQRVALLAVGGGVTAGCVILELGA